MFTFKAIVERLLWSCSSRRSVSILLNSGIEKSESFIDWVALGENRYGVPALMVPERIGAIREELKSAAKTGLLCLWVHKQLALKDVEGDARTVLETYLLVAKEAVAKTGAELRVVIVGAGLEHAGWIRPLLQEQGVEELLVDDFYRKIQKLKMPTRACEGKHASRGVRKAFAELRTLCSLL